MDQVIMNLLLPLQKIPLVEKEEDTTTWLLWRAMIYSRKILKKDVLYCLSERTDSKVRVFRGPIKRKKITILTQGYQNRFFVRE
jgi:hypothetical protein